MSHLSKREYIKYQLCFLKKYSDEFYKYDTEPYDKEVDDAKILKEVSATFPYEKVKFLETIQEQIIANLNRGMNPETTYQYLREKFKNQLDNIFSNNLYHFTSNLKYLLISLENKRLYPSNVNLDEYLGDRPSYAFNEQLKRHNKTVSDIKNRYKKLESELAEKNSFHSDLLKKHDLPIYSCFTEMPESSLPFHAHHYGFWGISFKKSILVDKLSFGRRIGASTGISPVLYQDNFNNGIEAILLRYVIEAKNDKVRSSYLEELLKIKPCLYDDFAPENFYSVYFEREWRYISREEPFDFELHDIESIFVSEEEWRTCNLIHNKGLTFKISDDLRKLTDFVVRNRIKVNTIPNQLFKEGGYSFYADE